MFQSMAIHLETMLVIAAGDLVAAEILAQHSLTLETADEIPASAGVYGVQMFAIRRAQGRLAEVTPVLQLLAASPDPPPVWRPGLAALYAELGMLDQAAAQFDELATDAFAAVPRDSMWPACLTFLAETCLALGDTDRAAVLTNELLPFRGRNLVAAFTICFGPAERLLGGLAELCGQPDVADRHFEAALALAERSRSPLWTAEVLFDWAADRRSGGTANGPSSSAAEPTNWQPESASAGGSRPADVPMPSSRRRCRLGSPSERPRCCAASPMGCPTETSASACSSARTPWPTTSEPSSARPAAPIAPKRRRTPTAPG